MGRSWDIGSLREHVKTKHPEDATELVSLINSLGQSQRIFEYHKCLARDAFQGFEDPLFFFEHQLQAGDRQEDWDKACLQSEANLIACISTVVNAFETFGKLLIKLKLSEASDSLYRVRTGLAKGELRSSLDAAIKSDWYRYLKAFNNTVKHHLLVTHQTSMSFEEGRYGGKVVSFTYDNPYLKEPENYEARWVEDVLKGVIEVSHSLVSCGLALNRHCLGD